MSLTATIAGPITSLCFVRPEVQSLKQQTNVWHSPVGVKPPCLRFHPFGRKRIVTHASGVKHAFGVKHASGVKRASLICAAALNATCAAEQTQTVTRQSSTITVAPIQGKEKSPELDDGGTGFPPRDDGDGGGGSGSGGHWSGGFFFFGFLAFLGFLKDQESEGPYREERRR